MMREIVLDTETTGLEPAEGHRLVEIGCVEMINGIPTGATFHQYLNPQRDMPAEAFRVHGLSGEFLADKPLFAAVAEEFIRFIDGARLVIHNAAFDMKFINAELARLTMPAIGMDRVVDTLALARRKHPGARASLDELCARYGIDASKRVKHGALVDAEILAEVYIELTGGRQTALGLAVQATAAAASRARLATSERPQPLATRLSEADVARHASFVGELGEGAIWRRYS